MGAMAVHLGLSSILLGGWLGGLVVSLLGPELAMAAAIWTGRTTEPVAPERSYPFLVPLLATGVCLLALHRCRATGTNQIHWAGVALAGAMAVLVAVWPLLVVAWLCSLA